MTLPGFRVPKRVVETGGGGTPTADDVEQQLQQQTRLKDISRVLRGLGLMRLEDTPDVGLTNFKSRMAEAPQDVLSGLRRMGRTSDNEAFLRELKPDIDEDGLTAIFGAPPSLPPVTQPPVQPLPRAKPSLPAQPSPPVQPPPFPPPQHLRRLPGTDVWGGLKVLGEGLATQLPAQVLSRLRTLTQGGAQGASVRNKDVNDAFIAEAQERAERFVEKITAQYGEKKFIPGIKITDVAQLPQNLAYSVVSGGIGAAVAAPFALIPAAGGWLFAGVTAGVSGKIAFDLTSYEIMQQYLEMKDAESIATRGNGITLAEENQLKADFQDEAFKYGLWEAVPEGVSNLLGARLILAPLTKMFGGALVKSFIPKLFGSFGGEFLTETITQKGQAGVEFRAGMRENIPDWFEAFKEIAPQTALLLATTAGAGAAAVGSARAISALKNEIGEGHPQFTRISDAIKTGLAAAKPAVGEFIAEERAAMPRPEEGVPKPAVPPPAPVTPEGAKEPWQMTQREWIDTQIRRLNPGKDEAFISRAKADLPQSIVEREHGEAIQQALSEGKPVSAEVLKDYPDLAAQAKVTPAPGITELRVNTQTGKTEIMKGGEVIGSTGIFYEKALDRLTLTDFVISKPEVLNRTLLRDIEQRFAGLAEERGLGNVAVVARAENAGLYQRSGYERVAGNLFQKKITDIKPQAIPKAEPEKVTPAPEVTKGIFKNPLQKTATDGERIYINPEAKFKSIKEIDKFLGEYRGVIKNKDYERARQIILDTEQGAIEHERGHLFSTTITRTPFGVDLYSVINKLNLEQETLLRQGKTLGRPPLLAGFLKYGETLNISSEEIPSQYALYKLFPEVQRKYFPEIYSLFEKNKSIIGQYNLPIVSPKAEPAVPGAPAVAEVTPPVTPLAPVEMTLAEPAVPPAKPPVPPGEIPPTEGEVPAPPPEGRPRTLTDMNREARGMRALSPEERAGVMDMAKPIAEDELLYKVKPFNEHGDILLQPDKPINKVLRSIPGIKQATEILYPAQMERDNPVALIGIKKRIFEEIETGRARLASLKWWYQAKQAFDFKKVRGKWRATNIALSPKAEPTKAYHATIHDLIEHPENYVFTEQQQKVLAAAQDMQNQLLRDAQREGVDAVELSGDYWRRIVTKAPKNALFDGKIKSRITSKKGYTRQRAFDFVDDGAKLGFEYETHPLRSLQNRLEAGIRTISDQSARKEIARLPGIVKPLARLESRYPQTIEGVKAARQARDTAKQTFLKSKTAENETLLRQAEADYVMAMREFYFKKMAVGQPNIGELKLPNGRIAPVELAEDVSRWVELPEIRTARGAVTNPILAVTQLLRSTLTNLDLAAGFIQGQALFYRNNLAWWISQGNAILSLVDDRMAYVEKNFEMMDEGMRMGAISIPTEFMFTSQGLASIPTRIPVVGPVMKAFNRAFEWFIVVGQTELYKAARSGVIRRATGANIKRGEALERQAIEALASLGSAIRKEMGTESYAILGVRPTQHTIEQVVFFAARFLRALVGIQAQSFTTGEGGREARRAMGSLIAGGLALLIAASWITEKKLPNMTDPFAPGWMMFKIRKTYFATFGPFYPYFRALARASFYLAHGEPDEAGKVIVRFLESKEGLLFRGIDMAAQFAMYGSYRTFEGKRLPATPPGIAEAVLGEMAVPISIQEAMTALPEGRYESVIGEIVGLVGRDIREEPVSEALSKLGKVDQEALDKALEGLTNPKKIAEIKEKDWTFDIQSVRKVISSRTKHLSESRISQLDPIVGAYWQFAEQKDEYELLSTKEKLQFVKDNPGFLVNRLFWGELTEIPDLKTAEAIEAQAKKHNISLDMIPAFQKTGKGKERIPSDRTLWQPYFDYYALPSSSYLNFTREQVDAGELPEKYRKEWETYHSYTTESARKAFRKARAHREITRGDRRDEFRRANLDFDKWLQENEGLKPLPKKGRAARANVRAQVVRSLFGGYRPPARRRRVAVPKFPKVRIAAGIGAPGAPRV